MGLLDGKKGLVLNIANDRSIGAHIGGNAAKQGATVGFGFLPMENREKNERRARKAADEHGVKDGVAVSPATSGATRTSRPSSPLQRKSSARSTSSSTRSPSATPRSSRRTRGTSPPPRAMRSSRRSTSSAYSLIALTRAAAPLMPDGGSVIALTYLGATQVIPGYNIMGVAKAALEASARYLAFDLGNKKIRVNTISAGPVKTLSAMGVGGIDEMFAHCERKAPLHRNHRRRRGRQDRRLPPQRPLQRCDRRKHLRGQRV